MSLYDQIPGYREAVEREQSNRDAAFVIDRDDLCGIEVLPMSARHFMILDGCASPFLCGGLPTLADVGVFLWVMSPGFKPGAAAARDAFLKSIRTVDYANAVFAIREFIDDATADAPEPSALGSRRQVYSWFTDYVDLIAHEYHWSEAEILACPLKRLFQYVRRIQLRKGGKTLFLNRSDEVRAEWLRENETKGEAN